MKTISCPILSAAQKVLDLTQDLNAAYRSLRKSLRKCRSCTHFKHCAAIEELNAQIIAAINQVAIEFDIQ